MHWQPQRLTPQQTMSQRSEQRIERLQLLRCINCDAGKHNGCCSYSYDDDNRYTCLLAAWPPAHFTDGTVMVARCECKKKMRCWQQRQRVTRNENRYDWQIHLGLFVPAFRQRLRVAFHRQPFLLPQSPFLFSLNQIIVILDSAAYTNFCQLIGNWHSLTLYSKNVIIVQQLLTGHDSYSKFFK